MKLALRFTLIIFTTVLCCFGQTNNDIVKKNYCDRKSCTLKPDNPIHFDPYYNGHLCENFNPEQIDYSKEYFFLRTKTYAGDTNKLQETKQFDFSAIWLTENTEQNGVLGLNYQRIRFHIEKVSLSKNKPDTYFIEGKSNVNNNICSFKGEIKLLKVSLFDSCDYSEHKSCGKLFADYIFYEDKSQHHSGIFKGVTECSFYADNINRKMLLDESETMSDGYWNRTFVGTWTNYKSKEAMKCIWGDYRLPFVFDFMCGDGEMRVCKKYEMNGWKSYNDFSEYIEVLKDKYELKNKWWLTK
ncbi:MAG: hypothetical protein ABI723_20760 [Bacteroidia bacterium]